VQQENAPPVDIPADFNGICGVGITVIEFDGAIIVQKVLYDFVFVSVFIVLTCLCIPGSLRVIVTQNHTITQVFPGGPAARSGLVMKGDLVQRLDYRTVSDMPIEEVHHTRTHTYSMYCPPHPTTPTRTHTDSIIWRRMNSASCKNTRSTPLNVHTHTHTHIQVRSLMQGPRLSSVVLGLIKVPFLRNSCVHIMFLYMLTIHVFLQPKYRLRVNVRLQREYVAEVRLSLSLSLSRQRASAARVFPLILRFECRVSRSHSESTRRN